MISCFFYKIYLRIYAAMSRRKLTEFNTFLNNDIFFCCSARKELSFRHKIQFSNPYIFTTWFCKPLIFKTKNIWSNRIQSLKFKRSTTSGCRAIGIVKSKSVAKTQFLWSSNMLPFLSPPCPNLSLPTPPLPPSYPSLISPSSLPCHIISLLLLAPTENWICWRKIRRKLDSTQRVHNFKWPSEKS